MALFELILVLLLTGAEATLDPEPALALFVAPTLLDAAFDASPRDLRSNWLPVGSLALVAVAATVAAVAIVAHWLVPGMPWPVAIVLGTLVIQGMTLAPLMRGLRLVDNGALARELTLARERTAEIALVVLRATRGAPASALVAEHEAIVSSADRHTLTLKVIAAKRVRLHELRRSFVIGDQTFHQLEEELDWAEGHTLRRLRSVA